MQLDELFDYKNQFMEDLVTNPEVVNLINEHTDPDEPESLIYTQIFPYEYIPETVEKGHTFVCCDVDVNSTVGKTLANISIYVWVFTHKSNLRLPEGGVRTDKICSEICKMLNGSMKYGLGELNLYAVKRFAPLTGYQGKMMTFFAKDISKYYDGKKEIPVNRKRGF